MKPNGKIQVYRGNFLIGRANGHNQLSSGERNQMHWPDVSMQCMGECRTQTDLSDTGSQ